MRSEDLFISAEKVVVKYRFLNTARADKTIRVAFPMPDIEFSESPMGRVSEDPQNLLDFVTTVDGRRVVAEVEQKALQGENDVTARLQALGIPLAPHLEATWKALVPSWLLSRTISLASLASIWLAWRRRTRCLVCSLRVRSAALMARS